MTNTLLEIPVGTPFGQLVTVAAPHRTRLKNGTPIAAVMCDCSCGNRRQVLVSNLKAGKSTTCGACKSNSLPKAGDTVGAWTVLSVDGRYAVCRCSCGTTRRVFIYTLGKDSSSCHGRKNDGRRRAKLKRIWLLMKDRCEHEESIGWKDYGARGIRVCPEWQDFEAFYQWAVAEGYQMLSGLQIDREDYNGPYAPWNCRWVDKFVNARNKRNTVWVAAFGETRALPEWLEDARCTVTYATLWSRIKKDWKPEDAISLPPRCRRPEASD